jgi:predicted nucleic acid-binding protein
MILVCNTGPLIALAKIDRMTLLQHLDIERILIPPMLQKELWSKIGPESPLIEFALNHFIHVSQIEGSDQRIVRATSNLDDGEKEVILLGASLQEDVVLLLDDQAGRRMAKELGFLVLGTAGLLLLAKQLGFVEAVGPLLEEMRRHGYWLSDAVVEQVQRQAGEQNT